MKLVAVALLMAALGGAARPPTLVRAQAWTAPGETLVHDLTSAPVECLRATTPQSEAGRALFRSPALLGGPAARLGLSCNACHGNGRVNARFLLPELTDRAGAADVTSEWASRLRGDGIANPIDIPDLVGASLRVRFGRAGDPSLAHFVRSVIVEEFQGAEPAPSTLAALLAYIGALDASACVTAEAPLTLADAVGDVRRALTAAEESSDAALTSLVVASAQDMLGRIAERLPRARFARDRARLAELSRELTPLRDDVAALRLALPGWRARFDAIATRLAPRERFTYFNETTLAGALRN